MTDGLSDDLILAALVTLVACIWLLAGRLGLAWAYALSLVKVGLTFAYFTLYEVVPWRLLDDVKYAEEGARLLREGGSALALLAGETGEELGQVAEGHHVGYYVVNAFAQSLFGTHYYAAVFVNVFLTCVAARALFRLLDLAGAPRAYTRAAVIFFLVQWDVLAWSSFFNMKDTLVLTMTAWLFAFGVDVLRRPRLAPLLGIGLVSVGFYFVRWYVPIVFLGVFGLWWVLRARGWRRTAPLLAGVALVAFLPRGSIPLDRVQPANLVDGVFRFLLTPRPWAIQPNYRFLFVPTVLHWAFLPIAVWGAIHLWRRYPMLRPLVLYWLALTFLYALVPRLEGPRHRFQGAFILALLQFHGVHAALRQALWRPAIRARARVAPAGGGSGGVVT